MSMNNVSTAELKAHLGKYLRMVRDGETVQVTSYRHAVARLVPSGGGEESAVVPPTRPVSDLKKLKPIKLSRPVDGVRVLLEDRSRR
jgi:prevent-host-death family protein